MSLIKQLWLGILIVTVGAFAASFVISTLSARDYLQQQLDQKNRDNANVLALAMTQMPKDPATIELLLSAQFDNAHYDFIRITDPTGSKVIAERVRDEETTRQTDAENERGTAPQWFRRLIRLSSSEGRAFVNDGWGAFGTLTLKTHTGFAYQSLWNGTLDLFAWFVAGAGIIGALATLMLRWVLRPLDQVIAHARAIGERRFVTTATPPTREFASVVTAMNTLSTRVRGMLEEEAVRLDHLRRAVQHDAVSGLLNREHFLAHVDDTLQNETAPANGALVMVRLTHVIALNEALGRATTDDLLRKLAEALSSLIGSNSAWFAGRLNGTDFALLAPGAEDPVALAKTLAERLDLGVGSGLPQAHRSLPVGVACYQRSDPLPQLLAHGDMALIRSESMEGTPPQIEHVNPATRPVTDLAGWRGLISEALAMDNFHLVRFPVCNRERGLLHLEAPVRMRHPREATVLTAGDIVPWATRCGLLPHIDALVVDQALALIAATGNAVCINLSAESMCHAATVSRLTAALKKHPEAATQLWIDLPESAAFRHAAQFRMLCGELKPLGCKIGLEHVHQHIGQIGDLHDVGLDYLKISASVVRDIDHNPGNQTFLRGLATIGHTMGMLVIAEGVSNDREAGQMLALGFDGMTGPGIRTPTA